MKFRIPPESADRPAAWRTIEAPLDVLAAIESTSRDDFLVVDCLTLWVANLLAKDRDASDIDTAAQDVARELSYRRGVVVSNEVGSGIVPEYPLGRRYRDLLGRALAHDASARYPDASVMLADQGVEGRSPEGMERGIAFLENHPTLEGYVIDANGIATLTSGFAAYTKP